MTIVEERAISRTNWPPLSALCSWIGRKRRSGRAGQKFPTGSSVQRLGPAVTSPTLSRRVFHKLLAKAGLRRVRFHDLRHTFASRLLQNGESLVYVKDQTGHHSIQVTVDIYGHSVPGANRAAVNRLDDDAQPRLSAILPQPIQRKREQG